jgi:hypothetical protein
MELIKSEVWDEYSLKKYNEIDPILIENLPQDVSVLILLILWQLRIKDIANKCDLISLETCLEYSSTSDYSSHIIDEDDRFNFMYTTFDNVDFIVKTYTYHYVDYGTRFNDRWLSIRKNTNAVNLISYQINNRIYPKKNISLADFGIRGVVAYEITVDSIKYPIRYDPCKLCYKCVTHHLF